MKKIQKLKLHDVVELSNSEMSQLWGGYEDFKGAWWICLCSKPNVYAPRPDATDTILIQATSPEKAADTAKERCWMFNKITCTPTYL